MEGELFDRRATRDVMGSGQERMNWAIRRGKKKRQEERITSIQDFARSEKGVR
jgi:hypothetical protein